MWVKTGERFDTVAIMTDFKHTVTNLPEENEYPKLIRDKIPEIIKAHDGRDVQVETLSGEEFEKQLRRKMIEEASELAAADTDDHLLEEIADVQELIDEIIEFKGYTHEQAKVVQDQKRDKRGGFKKRLLMLGNE